MRPRRAKQPASCHTAGSRATAGTQACSSSLLWGSFCCSQPHTCPWPRYKNTLASSSFRNHWLTPLSFLKMAFSCSSSWPSFLSSSLPPLPYNMCTLKQRKSHAKEFKLNIIISPGHSPELIFPRRLWVCLFSPGNDYQTLNTTLISMFLSLSSF